ncbi:DUF1572 family protein [Niabella hibiscisoli]|uniref:DUF1572 family protein n=1 Tax=Niabella hibiscisoli TaxID=1825928 RepID=UPI001F0E0C8D|nr:DUF1572 family protein [Niabella hibiscisoli]MCH5718076.1 DUF1572 domain-containing protein [Niabella hibiscisoli]
MSPAIFLKSALQQFIDYKTLADKTFAQLGEKDFHFTPGEGSNNLAVIIRHMNGNMVSRWTNFLTEDGEKEGRNRDNEFNGQEESKSQLMELWEQGWTILFKALESLEDEDLDKMVYIRTKPLTVVEAVHRQLTHYASHVGQIVYIGKMIRGNNWQNLSIAKGGSTLFNEQMKKA